MEIDTEVKINEIRHAIEEGAAGVTLVALLEKLYNYGVCDGILKTKMETLPSIEPNFVPEQVSQDQDPYSIRWVPFNQSRPVWEWYVGAGGIGGGGGGGSHPYGYTSDSMTNNVSWSTRMTNEVVNSVGDQVVSWTNDIIGTAE